MITCAIGSANSELNNSSIMHRAVSKSNMKHLDSDKLEEDLKNAPWGILDVNDVNNILDLFRHVRDTHEPKATERQRRKSAP